MSKRAFTPNGISKRAQAILAKERKHFTKLFASTRDVDSQDLCLLLITEMNLASALENAARRATARRGV